MRTVHDVLGRKHIPEIDIDIYPQDIYPTQNFIDGPHCCTKSVTSDFCQGYVCKFQKATFKTSETDVHGLSTLQIYAKMFKL